MGQKNRQSPLLLSTAARTKKSCISWVAKRTICCVSVEENRAKKCRTQVNYKINLSPKGKGLRMSVRVRQMEMDGRTEWDTKSLYTSECAWLCVYDREGERASVCLLADRSALLLWASSAFPGWLIFDPIQNDMIWPWFRCEVTMAAPKEVSI